MGYQIKNAINYKKLLILIQKQGKQRVNMSLHLMASLMIIMQQRNLRYKTILRAVMKKQVILIKEYIKMFILFTILKRKMVCQSS